MKRLPALAAVVLAGLAATAATAQASAQRTFSGSCSFSGPIEPDPPITVVPVPGAHFSYQGAGACSGTLDATSVSAVATTVAFTNVATAFDTCELGPDFNLAGTMKIGTAAFAITIDLARLALVGPFALTTPGGGEALGTAEFTPPNAAQALQQCGGSGIGTATLSASFNTVSPLIGAEGPVPAAARIRMAVRWPRSRRHHHKAHHRHRH